MAVTASANTPFLAVESPRELLHQSFVSSARNRVSADFQSDILAVDSFVFDPRACRHPRVSSALAARRDAACQKNRTIRPLSVAGSPNSGASPGIRGSSTNYA